MVGFFYVYGGVIKAHSNTPFLLKEGHLHDKRFALALTIYIFLSLSLLIQDYLATPWARTYGHNYYVFFGQSIQQTSDGGYIMAGRTSSFGSKVVYGFAMWILTLDSNGNIFAGLRC